MFVAFHRPVVNFDEIPFHFIDCIHHHLRSKLKVRMVPYICYLSIYFLLDHSDDRWQWILHKLSGISSTENCILIYMIIISVDFSTKSHVWIHRRKLWWSQNHSGQKQLHLAFATVHYDFSLTLVLHLLSKHCLAAWLFNSMPYFSILIIDGGNHICRSSCIRLIFENSCQKHI